jgi:DNA-binding transcriptional LysR family regulator
MSDIRPVDIRRLDGSLLLVFRELLRHRSATQAAKYLSLTQSAVSHALARLRDLFGDPLFVRRPHGLEPTRRALELGPRIDALIDLVATTLETDGSFDPNRSERRFSLAAPEFVTALIGARLFSNLNRMAPKVSIHIQFLRHEHAWDALRRGEIDLAVGRFGNLRRAGISVETLYVDQYCVVARKRHPQLKKGSITLAEYSKIGHIFAGAYSEGAPDEALPHPRLVATTGVVPHWLTVLTLVSATDAITTCPQRLAESQQAPLNLQLLKAPFRTRPFTVSAARSTTRDVGADWFLEQVRASLD